MLARTPKSKPRDKIKPRRADATDAAVGQRIRARRIEQKLSQTDLGDGCGVTFQQIQKYERGANRVGAGRLVRIAAALEVEPATLLGAASGNGAETLGDRLTKTKLGSRLAAAALAIKSPAKLKNLVALAESLRS